MNNETIKIESVNNYLGTIKKIIKIAIIVAVVSAIIWGIAGEQSDKYYRIKWSSSVKYGSEEYEKYGDKLSFYRDLESFGMINTIAGGSATIVLIIFYLITKEMKIVVTDKRVYGKTIFGKQVDLPFDSISAIAKSWFKGIAVSTASGRIVFLLISNNEEIFKTISDLLIQRQDKREENKKTISTNNNAEELKQYKELLDSGIITQEEFDAKKKQLLGL